MKIFTHLYIHKTPIYNISVRIHLVRKYESQHTYDLHVWQRHVKVRGGVRMMPDHSDVREKERAQVALLR
jgi:hypothetical protein